MKKSILFAALAAAVIATGCNTNEEAQPVVNEEGGINFRTIVDKGTRATTIEGTADLTSFFVAANKANEEGLGFLEAAVYKNSTGWTYAPKKYFPTDGANLNFFAYYPIKDLNMTTALASTGVGAATTTFGYTVPADQKTARAAGDKLAQDLLVAATLNQGVVASDGDVELKFFHALSAVTFSAKNSYPATGEFSELDYTIENVQIANMANTGTFTYRAFANDAAVTTSWAPVFTATALKTYVAGLPEAGVSLVSGGVVKKLLTNNDVMMVMPQNNLSLATAAEVAAARVEYKTAYTAKFNEIYAATAGTPAVKAAAATAAAVLAATEAVEDELDGKGYVEITFNLKGGDGQYLFPVGSKLYLALPAAFVFEAGTRYNFNLVFGADDNTGSKLDDITFDVTVEAWDPQDVALN